MVATDNNTPHMCLSETIPFGGASQDQHVLFGPIHFVNHRCVHFNAEVSFLYSILSAAERVKAVHFY